GLRRLREPREPVATRLPLPPSCGPGDAGPRRMKRGRVSTGRRPRGRLCNGAEPPVSQFDPEPHEHHVLLPPRDAGSASSRVRPPGGLPAARPQEATRNLVHPRCAGLDVHQQTVVAWARVVEADRLHQEVRTFGTTTRDLLALGEWLTAWGCTHAVMESTGMYWKPVWPVLEPQLTLLLANAQD